MAKNEPVKIIFDTNWYISFLLTGRPKELGKIRVRENFEILISDKLVEEFNEVVANRKFRKYFSKSRARKYFRYIISRCTFIDVKSLVAACRDVKDNYLLALAKGSKAYFLIPGRKDLLEIKLFEGTVICPFSDFIHKYFKK
mgnify:FL=1